eukprot:5112218-Heterocapsa_arctica.AAC.1
MGITLTSMPARCVSGQRELKDAGPKLGHVQRKLARHCTRPPFLLYRSHKAPAAGPLRPPSEAGPRMKRAPLR